jgi:hypothetical protein
MTRTTPLARTAHPAKQEKIRIGPSRPEGSPSSLHLVPDGDAPAHAEHGR